MIKREYPFERAVRLSTYELLSVEGRHIFPMFAREGNISARFCSYLVNDIGEKGAPSLGDTGDLGMAFRQFEEGQTSCVIFTPTDTFEQAEEKIRIAAGKMASVEAVPA